jgi:hypothetical protein
VCTVQPNNADLLSNKHYRPSRHSWSCTPFF